MKIPVPTSATRIRARGFTLPELMVAAVIGLAIGGVVSIATFQAAVEQRQGLAIATVEQEAHLLEANLIRCLRDKSANQGITPDFNTAFYDPGGHLLGYHRVNFFQPRSDGTYQRGQLTMDPGSGQVTYLPDVTQPAGAILLTKTNPAAALRQLYFNRSANPDGSLNSSLVNVWFFMDDNGVGRHTPTRNPASVCRSFSVRLRTDA